VAPRPDGQRLEHRETTASGGVGPARLAAAAHRGSDRRSTGDGERVPEGGRGAGASAARLGPAATGKAGQRDVHRPCAQPKSGQRPVHRPRRGGKTGQRGVHRLRAWRPRPGRAPAASASEPYRELVEAALAAGRNATAIWQDLVDDHGFPGRYRRCTLRHHAPRAGGQGRLSDRRPSRVRFRGGALSLLFGTPTADT
jgi:hypothetical protein